MKFAPGSNKNTLFTTVLFNISANFSDLSYSHFFLLLRKSRAARAKNSNKIAFPLAMCIIADNFKISWAINKHC